MKAVEKPIRSTVLAAFSCLPLALLALAPARTLAQETPPPQEPPAAQVEEKPPAEAPVVEEEITVTGTRFEGRAVTETLAPVDYISNATLLSTGAVETGQILQRLEPSANFSTTFISDGTDAVRPATLRSLGPDQTLVLVNGKRRHQQSLVHYQQTVGRGSAGYDINAIPASAIDHIEVLRDGAAAQYGSDAIAGVVNIILKEQAGATDVSLQAGATYKSDGELYLGAVNTGWKIGDQGFLNLTAEYRDRGETNRAIDDVLRVSPPRVTQRIGDPDEQDALLWLNASVPTGAGEFYAFGGWSERKTNSSGFFRSAGDGRTVPAIYPEGFLPTIKAKPIDTSMVAGFRGAIGDDWHWDASLNWGRSEFEFREENTVNVSWFYEPQNPANPTGPRFNESPTAADTGTLEYDQLAANVDFTGQLAWGLGAGPLNMAFGAEWRNEGYKITPGDPVSYFYGRSNNFNIRIFNQAGGIAAPGTQGFPGFQEAVDEDRDSIAAYVDFESPLTSKFQAGFALRYEDFSDFGSTVTGKLSGRLDFNEKLALRGTLSTGFRAPGVQQAFFTLRSTNLDASGTLADTLTAANNSAVTRALGVPDLKEETSQNYSLGLVARPNKNFRLTIDAYQIDIDDRIVFSDAVSASIPAVGAILNPLGIGQVQFFTNAIDTKTTGLDIVGVYDVRLTSSLLSLEAALSFNDTSVENRRSASPIIPANVLFPEAQVTLVERGQPREHYVLGGTWFKDPFSVNLRFNYFGAVEAQWFTQPTTIRWGGKWLTDLSLSYKMPNGLNVSLGGLNILDQYPDKWSETAAAPFPQLGFAYGWETMPFGINGGSYYLRLGYHF